MVQVRQDGHQGTSAGMSLNQEADLCKQPVCRFMRIFVRTLFQRRQQQRGGVLWTLPEFQGAAIQSFRLLGSLNMSQVLRSETATTKQMLGCWTVGRQALHIHFRWTGMVVRLLASTLSCKENLDDATMECLIGARKAASKSSLVAKAAEKAEE